MPQNFEISIKTKAEFNVDELEKIIKEALEYMRIDLAESPSVTWSNSDYQDYDEYWNSSQSCW